MPKKLTKEDFIKRAKEIHNNYYDYSKVEYINSKTKVCIICPIHGEFWQVPTSHLNKNGCYLCGQNKCRKIRKTKDWFITEAKKVHGDKYDYSKVEYNGSRKKVCIICPIHGEFWQEAYIHLKGSGCLKCFNNYKRGKSRKHNTDWFISEAKKVHGDKYDYSKVEYTHLFTKVCIICPIHGEFWQTPANHIYSKNGCDKCSGTYKLSTEEFIEKAQKIHGDKYDYSKVKYEYNKTKVCIICPKHGEFWQKPNSHLNGQGCPKCKSSHMEREIRLFFEQHNVLYEEQKTFEWLKLKKQQYLDFYLPEYNVAIECQGEHHFQKSGWGKGNNTEKVLKRDLNKFKLCENHNIKLYYYSNLNINYPYEVFEDKEKLLNTIKGC